MNRKFSYVPMTEASLAEKRHYERLLEIAKWPEQEQVWDIDNWDEANSADAPLVPPMPPGTQHQRTFDIVRWEEADRAEGPSRPHRAYRGEEDAGSNSAKIVGVIIIGLLLIGTGIYTYEMSSANAPQPVAMKPSVLRGIGIEQPVKQPAMATAAVAPDPSIVPSQSASDNILPSPALTANSSKDRSPLPQVPDADDPINAPMTLTPETAPAPQQSAPATP